MSKRVLANNYTTHWPSALNLNMFISLGQRIGLLIHTFKCHSYLGCENIFKRYDPFGLSTSNFVEKIPFVKQNRIKRQSHIDLKKSVREPLHFPLHYIFLTMEQKKFTSVFMHFASWLNLLSYFYEIQRFNVICIYFFLQKCWESEVCYSLNWFKPPMIVIDQGGNSTFLWEIIKAIINFKKTRQMVLFLFASWCSTWFCAVLSVGFCTGHFVMVPLNLTCLHCLQHSFFAYLFNLYYVYFSLGLPDPNCCDLV